MNAHDPALTDLAIPIGRDAHARAGATSHQRSAISHQEFLNADQLNADRSPHCAIPGELHAVTPWSVNTSEHINALILIFALGRIVF
jgi:hypothetical protein